MDLQLGESLSKGFWQDKGGSGHEGTHWALLALERKGSELQGTYYDSMGAWV